MRMTKVMMAATVATVVSAVAVGGYWLGRARTLQPTERGRSEEPAAGLDETEHDSRLAGALGRLEGRMAALEIKQATATAPTAAAPEPAAAPPAPAKNEAPDPAAEEARHLEGEARIQAVLRAEPRDRAWASPTEGNLRATIDTVVSEGGKFAVKDVKCLTSLCEMVLSANAPDDLKYLTDQLSPKITGMGSMELLPPTVGTDGRATVTCRFFRQGYPRPDEGLL